MVLEWIITRTLARRIMSPSSASDVHVNLHLTEETVVGMELTIGLCDD